MLAVLAYRTAVLLAWAMPARAAAALAVALARAGFWLHVPARQALLANLGRALPAMPQDARNRLARETFERFACACARFLAAAPPARPEVEGGEHLEAARRRGSGVIVLSAHVGDWERGAACLAAAGLPLHVFARPHASPAVHALFRARREAAGVRELPGGRPLVSMSHALRAGQWVAIMADRSAHPGMHTSVCRWAAAVAQRTGAVVLPIVYVEDAAGGARLCIEPPLSPERCRDGAFRDTLAGWIGRFPARWAAFEPLPEGIVGT